MNSPFTRVAALAGGLIGAAVLIGYVGLGASLASGETEALAGLPQPTQAQARDLYWSVRLAPWSSSNYTRLGMFFLANNRPTPAVEWLRRATVWDAGSWHAWYYLGLAQAASRHYTEADATFHKVLELRPDYIAAKYQLATLLFDRGRFEDAADAYSALLPTGADRTRVLQGLGESLLGSHDYRTAERAFTQAIARFATYGAAHAGLAAALKASGNSGDAFRAAHETRFAYNFRSMEPIRADDPLIEEMEETFPTALSLVQKAARTRDARTGIEGVEKALALDPGMTLAWETIISMYGQARRPEDALRAWNKLAALDPRNVRGRYDLAVALVASDRPRAAELANQILAIDPSYQDAHRVLGVIAELGGNMDEAARQFRIAIDGDPSLAEARVNLGLVFLRTGKTQEAQAELLRALLPPCENPPRTLVRELTALKDRKFEQAYEQAVRGQAEQQKQYALITILNGRKSRP